MTICIENLVIPKMERALSICIVLKEYRDRELSLSLSLCTNICQQASHVVCRSAGLEGSVP